MNQTVQEIIGYIGTALVLASFLMTSIVKLRIVSICGSVASGLYSLIIQAWPTFFMNAALVVINVYFLIKLSKTKNVYHIIDTNGGNPNLDYFLNFYGSDIKKYFPDFKFEGSADVIRFIYCEATPAGVFIANNNGEGALDILLDYTIPAYRDFSAGAYLFETLANEGFTKVTLNAKTNEHSKYITSVGFTKTETGYEKTL